MMCRLTLEGWIRGSRIEAPGLWWILACAGDEEACLRVHRSGRGLCPRNAALGWAESD
jgi:hypothetical protein